MIDNNTILIKSKDGQMKTVSLDVSENSSQIMGNSQQFNNINNRAIEQLNNEGVQKPAADTTKTDFKVAKKPQAPAFYFSVEDEEEVNEFRNGKSQNLRNKKEQLYKITASKIAGDAQGFLPEQKIRLENVILSRLLDIRSLIELKEVLIKDRQIGGIGLSKEQANSLVREIEKERVKLDEFDEHFLDNVLSTLRQAQGRQKTQEQEVEKSRKEISFLRDRLRNPESWGEIKEYEVPQTAKRPFKAVISTQEIIPPDKIKKLEQETIKAKPVLKPSFDFDLSQIKREKRTTSPLEELSAIDLNEFRTYGKDAKLRVNKIYDKIKLLEDESIEKKSTGVKAWKSSPLYIEYLKTGEKSLARGIPVSDVLSNQNSLDIEEFEAIADLNQELNY